jgi:hypothetical protein
MIVDEVYAGLFAKEWRDHIQLNAGWNLIQAKALSHWGQGSEWGFHASLFEQDGVTALAGVAVDACAMEPAARSGACTGPSAL